MIENRALANMVRDKNLREFSCCNDDHRDVSASAHHGRHRVCVREERRRKEGELKNLQKKSKNIINEQERQQKNLEATLQQIQKVAGQTQGFCEGVVVSVISSLQRHCESLKELIKAQEQGAMAQVHSSIRTLQAKMEEMKKRDAELDRLAQTDNNAHFLQEWASLRCRCQKDHLHPLPELSEDPLLPFVLTKGAVHELGRQLEEFCDKEFLSISDTVSYGLGSTLTGQSSEPTTRAEFLQYACELTLDRSTAHEDLVVSEGDKEAKPRPPQTARFTAPRDPRRFTHRRQVLCREGLQAERCYYEIELEGNKAEIALTYKGIDRKSRTRLSAFGANENSWSLDRSTHYSVSHNGKSVQLTVSPSHHRTGIYLKFKEGTLSFYEVSDSMTFLYKVEATFTEPLYPGFWLEKNCCIRISDLRQDML
ncbi:tripartite motif-containing protein 16-like [Echeneis naucrates]|uniref:Tripartite motif-containing protein 16-like n=1 Tax=Echeneis naucrates TaxID=173247 RepID=A0A665U3P8_ECHNA|nr:tripartite motif-containing protein 16-like [Echeneis naucrates]